MENKCDICTHSVVSDERDVGAGYVPFCNKHHWSGDCGDAEEQQCAYGESCLDYNLKQN
ncbi:MAG TPA: hypothetical protein VIK72_19450 [Clostridiaceae bacterium]